MNKDSLSVFNRFLKCMTSALDVRKLVFFSSSLSLVLFCL
nr:MAG TPA: hypothetical protein [Caudoviricetes sp.]